MKKTVSCWVTYTPGAYVAEKALRWLALNQGPWGIGRLHQPSPHNYKCFFSSQTVLCFAQAAQQGIFWIGKTVMLHLLEGPV